ncbi:hypothetical protein JIG36_41705 [Actinoplanes sp. LDG1-06]|uniref:Uncharacterized protein n=1 Tax=Paractinoplanes ovalisporus TaxID=2810368 RepID=A0ABS2ASA9_9ACTN|nr:hypothetical protein [Actinoplanes ovalisporus]MBM2622039.1 hypothetical protein [Actinoplanes ovalisporus]
MRRRPPPPTDDLTKRFGTVCPVCGSSLGVDEPEIDEESDRFVRPPSFRLEVGAADKQNQHRHPWRVTMLAGNFPPAESTGPRFNPHDVEFVYLLCGDGHVFPDETPAFRAGAHRGGDARQRVDDFNMVAAVGSPASGKTYLLIRTLSQNLDILTHTDDDDDVGRIRSRELSPLEALPTANRVEHFNETRYSGTAIAPTSTGNASYPSGIMEEEFPDALHAIQALIEKTVLDGRRRAEDWGTGFRQPLVLRTDSDDHRTWTGVADLPGELFMPNAVNRREAGKLSAFDALVWVVDPAVAPRAMDWIAVDPGTDEQAQLDGSLRPGTSGPAGTDVVRINREQIQDTIGRRITVIDGPFARNEGRALQMLVAVSKCDLIHAALSKSGLHLTDLGTPGQVQRGAARYLSFALNRWMKELAGADPDAARLFGYLRGSANAAASGRRLRIEQVARGLLDHYSQEAEFWKLLHWGTDSHIKIQATSNAELPQQIRVPTLDEHLDSARRPGSAGEFLIRDLVMSTVGCGIAYALNQETALLRMQQEPWIELRFFLCSPLTTVPVAVDNLHLKPLDPRDRFPPVDDRAAGLTQLLLALLERARR